MLDIMKYHIKLNSDLIRGAKYSILAGDPARIPLIADFFEDNYGEIAHNREFLSYLVGYKKEKIVIVSTGIGGPGTSIVVDELASIGINNFLRIGTTGAIQEYIKTGDLIITTGSVRLDGASIQYAPIEYPAVANYEIVEMLARSARELGYRFYTGITASTDTFYPGQERYDSFSGNVLNRLKGSKEELRRLNVLNYEMESATLLTLTNVFNFRAGCITVVISERDKDENINDFNLIKYENKCIITGVSAIKHLIDND